MWSYQRAPNGPVMLRFYKLEYGSDNGLQFKQCEAMFFCDLPTLDQLLMLCSFKWEIWMQNENLVLYLCSDVDWQARIQQYVGI
jgi:hypothetical protein